MQQNDAVYVDEYEARAWQEDHRQPYKHDEYLWGSTPMRKARKPTPAISYQEIGPAGARRLGTSRQCLAMGIDLSELPRTDNIQLITVQFARLVDGR